MGLNLRKGLVTLLWIGGLTTLLTGCAGSDGKPKSAATDRKAPIEIRPAYADSQHGVLCYEFYTQTVGTNNVVQCVVVGNGGR